MTITQQEFDLIVAHLIMRCWTLRFAAEGIYYAQKARN
jgi:hypothetical protein